MYTAANKAPESFPVPAEPAANGSNGGLQIRKQ